LKRPRLTWRFFVLLLVILVAVWVASLYRAIGLAMFLGGGRPQVVAANKGGLYVAVSTTQLGSDRAYTVAPIKITTENGQDLVDVLGGVAEFRKARAGFEVLLSESTAGGSTAALRLPIWSLVTLVTLIWTTKAFGREKRRRRRLGLCLNCGYDLRESPDRCPECGAPHANTAATKSLDSVNVSTR
jgi:hypothetical protein